MSDLENEYNRGLALANANLVTKEDLIRFEEKIKSASWEEYLSVLKKVYADIGEQYSDEEYLLTQMKLRIIEVELILGQRER